jgi:transposase-like protein
MARKRYTPEQIIGILREAEVRLSHGEKIGEISRSLGISEQSYYRWRREYGGLISRRRTSGSGRRCLILRSMR